MNRSENDFIFESYIRHNYLIVEDDSIDNRELALKSKFPDILDTIERENITDADAAVNRVRQLVRAWRDTSSSGKAKIIRHAQNAAESGGLEGVKTYLKRGADMFQKGGFIDPNASKAPDVKYHDPKWEAIPTEYPHYGDIVKYVGPIRADISSSDTYMIVQKIDNKQSRAPYDKYEYHIALYDWHQNRAVKGALPYTVKNVNFLKVTTNNLTRLKTIRDRERAQAMQEEKERAARLQRADNLATKKERMNRMRSSR